MLRGLWGLSKSILRVLWELLQGMVAYAVVGLLVYAYVMFVRDTPVGAALNTAWLIAGGLVYLGIIYLGLSSWIEGLTRSASGRGFRSGSDHAWRQANRQLDEREAALVELEADFEDVQAELSERESQLHAAGKEIAQLERDLEAAVQELADCLEER